MAQVTEAALALCAEEAGASPAFALSAQAKAARWRGLWLGGRQGMRYFARSADLARQGFECSQADAPMRVLLANQEASAAALLGDTLTARRALRDARDAAASLQIADSGLSTWSCPVPRSVIEALGRELPRQQVTISSVSLISHRTAVGLAPGCRCALRERWLTPGDPAWLPRQVIRRTEATHQCQWRAP
jgi:hypothetical protein